MIAWLFLHLLGLGLWLGGGFALMLVGLSADREGRPALGLMLRMQAGIARAIVAPGALATTLSGLMLTFGNVHAPNMGNPWMATMQGCGMLAALLALAMGVPTALRLARLDPMGPHAGFVDRLRKRQRLLGLVTTVLGLTALLAAVMYRYGG